MDDSCSAHNSGLLGRSGDVDERTPGGMGPRFVSNPVPLHIAEQLLAGNLAFGGLLDQRAKVLRNGPLSLAKLAHELRASIEHRRQFNTASKQLDCSLDVSVSGSLWRLWVLAHCLISYVIAVW
ncbi:hypothetical protein AAW51_2085 [Caldimonas brevitalea]|uniref:Uncharacterized protein n=1 Tax=Caldimonas brevitalea TaxID=413882 RepID=A0A0G3BN54_9BURK|nr:hypothetical protein AAW51_2085 [Caldimonas brevitalea]